ncbi:NADP-dependent oxidoreductase domain containing protein [Lactarius tabidus]
MPLNVNCRVPYVPLGKSGLKVSRIILGCLSYGNPEWRKWVLGEEEGIEQIKSAYEHGIQTFDTANSYSNGVSEIVLGKAIKQLNLPREEIVVMTKIHHVVSRSPGEEILDYEIADNLGYVNQYGLSRKHIFDAVQHSLRRLQLDHIDVLQCHRIDNDTHIEEMMQALHDVVQKGWTHHSVHQMQSETFSVQKGETYFIPSPDYAINNRLTPFISMQNHYNLIYREEEREMIPTLKHFGVASVPWSPLARGIFTRPLGVRSIRADNDRYGDLYLKEPSNQEVVRRVEEIANKRGAGIAQISLAWTLTKEVGTTSLDKLKELIVTDRVDIKLSEEDVKYLEEPYKPMATIGHS